MQSTTHPPYEMRRRCHGARSPTRRVELRNGVLVVNPADAKNSPHVDVTRRELAELAPRKSLPAKRSA